MGTNRTGKKGLIKERDKKCRWKVEDELPLCDIEMELIKKMMGLIVD